MNQRSNIKWTSSLAFEAINNVSGKTTIEQEIEAWAFIIENNIHENMIGYYKKNVDYIIEERLIILEANGKITINWGILKDYKKLSKWVIC